MKKLFLAVLLAVGLHISLYAEKIDRYHVDITIEQSGELAVKETIVYNFGDLQKHGIFRDIPQLIERKGRFKDIGLYDFSVMMDGFPVQWQKSKMHSTHAGEIIRLKIGSASSYVTKQHTYVITYRVKKGVLPAYQNEQNDAIRWNIIGTGWAVPLFNVQARIFFAPFTFARDHFALHLQRSLQNSNVIRCGTVA